MAEQLLNIINDQIARIEKSLREDIVEIKTDLKDLKQSQMEMSKLIIKLSNVEDKFRIQTEICKEARSILNRHDEKLIAIEKELEPIKQFMQWKNAVSAKITASMIMWVINLLFVLYVLLRGKL